MLTLVFSTSGNIYVFIEQEQIILKYGHIAVFSPFSLNKYLILPLYSYQNYKRLDKCQKIIWDDEAKMTSKDYWIK